MLLKVVSTVLLSVVALLSSSCSSRNPDFKKKWEAMPAFVLAHLTESYPQHAFEIIEIYDNSTALGDHSYEYVARVDSVTLDEEFTVGISAKNDLFIKWDTYPEVLVRQAYIDNLPEAFYTNYFKKVFYHISWPNEGRDVDWSTVKTLGDAKALLKNAKGLNWMIDVGAVVDSMEDKSALEAQLIEMSKAFRSYHASSYDFTVHFYPKEMAQLDLKFKKDGDIITRVPLREKRIGEWVFSWRESMLHKPGFSIADRVKKRREIYLGYSEPNKK